MNMSYRFDIFDDSLIIQDGTVVRIKADFVGTDADSGLSWTITVRVNDPQPLPNSFIPYDQLQESDVILWLETELKARNGADGHADEYEYYKAYMEQQIQEKINQGPAPAPIVVGPKLSFMQTK